jgi:hypothetical protein
MQFICRNQFKKCVDKYNGDRYSKSFSCWQQFITLIFAQAKGITSLRDIVISLKSQRSKWYHLGIANIAKSTIADANSKRDADIFRDIFYSLLEKCKKLSPARKFKFKNPIYAFDSTLINVCLSLYEWATYRKKKGAFKIHTLLDLCGGYLPTFLVLTEGKTHDINVVKNSLYGFPALSPDSILLVDRAYIDFIWLYSLTKSKLFFVTRAKSNMSYTITGQHGVPLKKNIVSDYSIRLNDHKDYPEELRLVICINHDTGEEIQFLTNNFKFAASTIAEMYKSRWAIETFFKWIKQNLKIKSFLGTSKNAVMTQIWVAMIYYLLLSFIKFQTKCRHSLHELTRILREILLDSVHLIEILNITFEKFKILNKSPVQLSLF